MPTGQPFSGRPPYARTSWGYFGPEWIWGVAPEAVGVVINTTAIELGLEMGVTTVDLGGGVVIDTGVIELGLEMGTTTVLIPPAVIVDTTAIEFGLVMGTTTITIAAVPPTGYWVEVWRRPGAADFKKIIDSPPFRDSSYHVGVGLLGDGTMSLPDRYPDIFSILDVPNEVGSLVRLREDFTGAIVGEWIPSSITPTADKDDPFVQVGGKGMNEIMGYAVLEAYDWDGTGVWVPKVPDWTWGGGNVLSDGDMENPQVTPSIQELVVTATGGNYTITDGVDTTASIAFNASAATIENRLETDIASINDVVVAQSSNSPRTFLILFVDPIVEPLAVNVGGLSGGTATIEEVQPATRLPGSWQKASALISGLPQNEAGYDEFAITNLQNHTPGGQYALRIDPGPMVATSNRNLGAQQVVNVIPTQTYQASVWIRPALSTDRFRLGIFTLGEEIVALSSPGGTTLTANTWNQITITDVVIPEGVEQVIFRVACTTFYPADPGLFDVDDAEFNEGLVPTTVGEIVRVFYEDATIDHLADGRIVWEDEANPGTPYLTLDFTDSLDSSGAAWANSEVSIRAWMRMTYIQILEALENQEGIEWRVVPVNPLTGVGGWLLQIYDEGNMDDAPSVTIQGGSQDTRRSLQQFRPMTAWMVEAEERVTARVANPSSGFGRIETARIDRTIPPHEDLAMLAADLDMANATSINDVWSYELVGPFDAPLVAYRIGDTIGVHDPPEVDDEGRVWELNLLLTPNAVRWDIDILKPLEE